MLRTRIAYMPLTTYPDVVEDEAIKATIGFAAALGCALHVKTFAVDLPRISSGLGDYLINVPGVIQAAEERSSTECERMRVVVQEAVSSRLEAQCTTRKVPLGAVFEAAASEARYCDLTLLPWSASAGAVPDMAEAVVFGSGRPAILVPPAISQPGSVDHLAVAWDGSRVATRAVFDAREFLQRAQAVTITAVTNEKTLPDQDAASRLAKYLARCGVKADVALVQSLDQPISETLQQHARQIGADLLVMGGFAHSRVRDFVLGGATSGMMKDLQHAVLLSH